jgi:hypothetical protein
MIDVPGAGWALSIRILAKPEATGNRDIVECRIVEKARFDLHSSGDCGVTEKKNQILYPFSKIFGVSRIVLRVAYIVIWIGKYLELLVPRQIEIDVPPILMRNVAVVPSATETDITDIQVLSGSVKWARFPNPGEVLDCIDSIRQAVLFPCVAG